MVSMLIVKLKSHFMTAGVCSLGTGVWEWQGAWLLSLRLDQHAGWDVGESGDWIQRLQASALPLISTPHLSWPLCCRSAEAQLGHKDTNVHKQTHTHCHVCQPSLSPICLLVCPSLCFRVSPSLIDCFSFFIHLLVLWLCLPSIFSL